MDKAASDPQVPTDAYTVFLQTCRQEHAFTHIGETDSFLEISKKCASEWKVTTKQI